MFEFSKELIQNTIEVWSPKVGYTLSEDEALEIIYNLTGHFETLNDIATNIENDLTKKLIVEADFKIVGDIDHLVPHEKGLYCIGLRSGSKLPVRYQNELEQRGSRLVYIGKAEKSLFDRFLKQELRAKGQGTFFRSVGAMLGYLPLRGSLKDKRNKKNYKFSKLDESRIIDWMNSNLEANWVTFDGPFLFEKYLIKTHSPLLNIEHNSNCLQALMTDRSRCRETASRSDYRKSIR